MSNSNILDFSNSTQLINRLDDLLWNEKTDILFVGLIKYYIDDLKDCVMSNFIEGYDATIREFQRDLKKYGFDISQ